MRGTLLLCDWAENVGGKLYAQGIGWSRIKADTPGNIAIGLMVHVPYDQTNTPFKAEVRLVTEDGAPFPVEQPAQFGFEFEVGRPPGVAKGEEQIVPFAAKLNGIVFTRGGYRVELEVADEIVATASFTAQ